MSNNIMSNGRPFVLVVALDLADTPSGGYALDQALRVARRVPDSLLHIVHVSTSDVKEETLGLLRHYVEEKAAALGGCEHQTVAVHVRKGDPGREIAELAAEVAADSDPRRVAQGPAPEDAPPRVHRGARDGHGHVPRRDRRTAPERPSGARDRRSRRRAPTAFRRGSRRRAPRGGAHVTRRATPSSTATATSTRTPRRCRSRLTTPRSRRPASTEDLGHGYGMPLRRASSPSMSSCSAPSTSRRNRCCASASCGPTPVVDIGSPIS